MKIEQTDALLLVDIQNDFLEGGSLAVKNSNSILSNVNSYISLFKQNNNQIAITRDWHPANHCSFKSNGGVWPTHCVANSFGAEFSKQLSWSNSIEIISKAVDENQEAYSGFEGTNLAGILNEKLVERIFVCGLATDYCVLHTVLDGLKLGFKVFVLEDGIKAVNVNESDGIKAINKMVDSGAVIINRKDLD